jgi:DNA-binding beta-propeller fold protein YncE
MSELAAVTAHSLIVPADFGATKFTDTMDIDQQAHRLYMGDNWSFGIDVFDLSEATPKYLKTIRSMNMRPAAFFGLCVAKPVNKVFVAHGTSLVSVIDIDPASAGFETVVTTMRTGGLGLADLIEFVPQLNKVYVANRDEGFMTSIDAVSNEVKATISGMGRALEQPRFNETDGMVYLVSNADNLIHQIDPRTDVLVRTFAIGDECNPNGMAINSKTNMALLAGDNHAHPHTVIWDLTHQKIAAVIDKCGGGDGAIYDPVVDRYFFAASGFPGGPVIGIFDGSSAELITNVPTAPGASWVAFDQMHRVVYAPAIQDARPALLWFPLGAAEGRG